MYIETSKDNIKRSQSGEDNGGEATIMSQSDFDRKHEDLNDAIGSMDRVIEQIEELLNHIGIPRDNMAAGSGDTNQVPTLLATLTQSPCDIRNKISRMQSLLSVVIKELT